MSYGTLLESFALEHITVHLATNMEQTLAVDHNNVDTFTLPLKTGALQGETKTTLLDLPVEILQRICEFLLSVKEVNRGYIDDGARTYWPQITYDFHTSVMRTNRALHEIARSVFAANHAIRIASSDHNVFYAMFGPAPAPRPPKIWLTHIKNAVEIRMDILFSTRHCREPSDHVISDKTLTGLVFLEDLGGLIMAMAAYELVGNSHLGLAICVRRDQFGRPQSLKLQHALFEPLKLLHDVGVGQVCRIGGAVDPMLARQMIRHLSPVVHWYRAPRWVAHQAVATQAELGDQAYRKCHYALAFSFYHSASHYLESVAKFHLSHKVCDDAKLWYSHHNMCCAIKLNGMATGLLASSSIDRDDRVEILEWIRDQPSRSLDGKGYLFNAMASLGLKLIDSVKPALILAASVHPELAKGLQIIKPWERQSPSKRRSTTGKYLKQLMELVPKLPVKPPVMDHPSQSVAIDRERYVLRALDYQGDLYEDRIAQKEDASIRDGVEVPHVFDQAEADREVEGYRRALEEQKASGEWCEVWPQPWWLVSTTNRPEHDRR